MKMHISCSGYVIDIDTVRVNHRSKICRPKYQIAFRKTTFRLIGTSDKLIYPKDELLAQCSDVTIEEPNKMGEWAVGAYVIPRLVFEQISCLQLSLLNFLGWCK